MILTDWQILLTGAHGYEVQPAAAAHDIAAFPGGLPPQLAALYLVSDGVWARDGHWFVVWPVADLFPRNDHEWNSLGHGRRELLAFGDDGTGGRFCVPRDGGLGVFLFNPLNPAPLWLANDVGDFWLGWTTGTITTYATAA
jgi:hypothetical protein